MSAAWLIELSESLKCQESNKDAHSQNSQNAIVCEIKCVTYIYLRDVLFFNESLFA